ncbi:DnaJ domain-containing protein [bacterium]|nr:DnaJ domain-containing protein [bacterium]
MDRNRIESLLEVVKQKLVESPGGISEYRLLKELMDLGDYFNTGIWTDNLRMFQAHFFLFHLLYLLRNRLRMNRRGDVHIHCLKIELVPWKRVDDRYPDRADPVQSYYLDLGNLTGTSASDVEHLLTTFWDLYSRFENRDDALAVLDLVEPVTLAEIRSRYRCLVRQHHPDRGGDPARFREVKAAARILLG